MFRTIRSPGSRKRHRFQAGYQLRSRLRPLVRILLQAGHDDALQLRRYRGLRSMGRRNRRRVHLLQKGFVSRQAFEYQPSREHPVADGSDRVDIGSGICVFCIECGFRRHERGCAGDHREQRARISRSLDATSETEVEDFDEVVVNGVLARDDVRRFDVAVHKTRLVGFIQRFQYLQQEMDRALGRNGAVLFNQCLQVEPIEILHDVIEGAVFGHAEVVHLHRVLRLKGRCRLGLAFKPSNQRRTEVSAGAERFRRDQFDSRGPCEHAVFCAPHFSHASAAQALCQFVVAHSSGTAERAPHAVDVSAQQQRPRC